MGWVRKAGGGVNTMGFGGVSEAGEGSTEWVWVGLVSEAEGGVNRVGVGRVGKWGWRRVNRVGVGGRSE